MSRYYTGSVSDHFDGVRFFDPRGAPPKSRRDLLRWMVDRHSRPPRPAWPAWPAVGPSPQAGRPPGRVEGASSRGCLVGPARVPVQVAGVDVGCGPVWSDGASGFGEAGPIRVEDAGVGFAGLPPIELVLA